MRFFRHLLLTFSLTAGVLLRAAALSPAQPYDIVTPADVDRLVDATFGPRQPPVDLAMVGGAWKTVLADATRTPVKVIFDTDIGSDIDDALALAFALSRPELDVLAVTTSRGEVEQRAAIVARLLRVLGREEVPIGRGSPKLINGTTLADKPVNQAAFARDADKRRAAAAEDAQALIKRVVEANPGEVWLVVVGPMTNAAILLRDHPEIAAQLKGIVAMGGEPTRPFPETNIRNDADAAAIVARSGRLAYLGTYDVTVRMLLPKPDMDRIKTSGSSFGGVLDELDRLWRVDRAMKPGPVVFDVCPLLWLFAPEMFSTVPMGLRVDEAGVMFPDKSAPPVAVTTNIDLVAAHRLLMDTLRHAGGEYAAHPERR